MAKHTLQELVRFVRGHSDFYRTLYKYLPDSPDIREIPVLSQDEFWKANSLFDNRVLTGPMSDGVVFKSGGTTGSPKFSIFSKEEWKIFTQAFGTGIASGILESSDRVVNLFYVGQLYGSFLFIHKSIEEAPLAVLQLPVGGSSDYTEARATIRDFRANVLAGVPSSILGLAESIRASGDNPKDYPIKKILFGGEPFYSDQRERLDSLFPGVLIQSIGYASTDAGLLGFSAKDCAPGEHRAFTDDTLLEILDDVTLEPIEDMNREGLIVVTDLNRSLMPIIRYPAGDRGLWLEPQGKAHRKFQLLGRSEEAARIGLIKLYVQDVRDAIEPCRLELGILDFQLMIVHRDLLDGLVVRVASSKITSSLPLNVVQSHSKDLIARIHQARPLYEEFAKDRKVNPIEIQWVALEGLERNSRTGKLRRVIDLRLS